jgi:lysosomal alpha-glucosidase
VILNHVFQKYISFLPLGVRLKPVISAIISSDIELKETNINNSSNTSNSTDNHTNGTEVLNITTTNSSSHTKNISENNSNSTINNSNQSPQKSEEYPDELLDPDREAFYKEREIDCSLYNTTNETIDPRDRYDLEKILKKNRTEFRALLKYKGSKKFFRECPSSPIVKNLLFKAAFEKRDELHILITDSQKKRFSLPEKEPFSFTKTSAEEKKFLQSNSVEFSYKIEYKSKGKFCFDVKRRTTEEKILGTCVDNETMWFSDKYIELNIKIPSKHIYGLGERRSQFLLTDGTYMIWPIDNAFLIDNGTVPRSQLYGHHPVYLVREQTGMWSLTYLRTSNPIEFTYQNQQLKFRIIGGRIELKIILCGFNPDECLEAYHEYINKFTLMPFWAFGFHQTRWGYSTSADLLNMIVNYKNYELPLDVVWSDIDYMNDYQDFSINENEFIASEMKFLRELDLKYVVILDIGIAARNDSEPFVEGIKKDLFIKSAVTNKTLYNWVWPGLAVFPDFNSKDVFKYWGDNLQAMKSKIDFDGIWLDMNEPAAFLDGERSALGIRRVNMSKYDFPYLPGNATLEKKTISVDSLHKSQGFFIDQENNLTELDFHALNGFTETIVTHQALKTRLSNRLPFIISRSTFVGQGAYSGHWTVRDKI